MKSIMIRGAIEQYFTAALAKQHIIPGISSTGAYGHSAGTPTEEWLRKQLILAGFEVYYPNEFLTRMFDNIGRDEDKIVESLKSYWWFPLLISKKQIRAYIAGKPIERWQQEAGDLVLIRKDDFSKDQNKIILINAKSHDASRESRAPNIMSAQRLLQFFHWIASKDDFENIIKDVEFWFIGIKYSTTTTGGMVKSVSVRNLFKLDVAQIPQINFDAAIQIQWHVEEMIEKEQTKTVFIGDLTNSFATQWKKHRDQKDKKYALIVKQINEQLSKLSHPVQATK